MHNLDSHSGHSGNKIMGHTLLAYPFWYVECTNYYYLYLFIVSLRPPHTTCPTCPASTLASERRKTKLGAESSRAGSMTPQLYWSIHQEWVLYRWFTVRIQSLSEKTWDTMAYSQGFTCIVDHTMGVLCFLEMGAYIHIHIYIYTHIHIYIYIYIHIYI